MCISENEIGDVAHLVEYGQVDLALNSSLSLMHARLLRGAIICVASRVEFHNHLDRGLVYQHPLIRYDTSEGHATILGLAHGAMLVRALPPLTSLRLGSRDFSITSRSIIADRIPIGVSPDMISYTFRTPYLALNQDNHEIWRRASNSERSQLLERVLIGNLLSLSKSIGLSVSSRLRAEINLVPGGFEEIKPGLRLLGFEGSFRTNFLLPQRWGIGKSSSRGFGTLTCQEA